MACSKVLHRVEAAYQSGPEVAPTSIDPVFKVYESYAPLWAALAPQTRDKVLKGNYERIFDNARIKVRAWEKENVK